MRPLTDAALGAALPIIERFPDSRWSELSGRFKGLAHRLRQQGARIVLAMPWEQEPTDGALRALLTAMQGAQEIPPDRTATAEATRLWILQQTEAQVRAVEDLALVRVEALRLAAQALAANRDRRPADEAPASELEGVLELSRQPDALEGLVSYLAPLRLLLRQSPPGVVLASLLRDQGAGDSGDRPDFRTQAERTLLLLDGALLQSPLPDEVGKARSYAQLLRAVCALSPREAALATQRMAQTVDRHHFLAQTLLAGALP
jgi:hypothetical protein